VSARERAPHTEVSKMENKVEDQEVGCETQVKGGDSKGKSNQGRSSKAPTSGQSNDAPNDLQRNEE
jgi:hypothetical protein